jgi:hypothetical protein
MKELLKQMLTSKKILNCILIVVIPALLFYIISMVTMKSQGFGVVEILRDPAQQSGASSFLGFLSNVGIFLWISSTALSFFFAFTKSVLKNKMHKELFFLVGSLSFLLAIDDFFMIHDRYIDQKICYLTYAICLGFIFVRHLKTIIKIDGFAFVLAGTFLACSIFADLIEKKTPFTYEQVQVVEEAFKFVGAATWLYFVTRLATFFVSSLKE